MKQYLFILLLLSILGCSNNNHTGQTHQGPYKRIISLSPSITRQILDLQAVNRLVGVTSYHPKLPHPITIVGDLVNPSIETILSLRPDIVLLSEEDSAVQKTSSVQKSGVFIKILPRAQNYQDLVANFKTIAHLTGSMNTFKQKSLKYHSIIQSFKPFATGQSVMFIVSARPIIVAGGSTFIGDIIRKNNLINIYEKLPSHYAPVSLSSILHAQPSIIITMGSSIGRELKKIINTHSKNFKPLMISVDPDPFAFYTPEDYYLSLTILREKLETSLQQ